MTLVRVRPARSSSSDDVGEASPREVFERSREASGKNDVKKIFARRPRG
jgi:hypothetical protein